MTHTICHLNAEPFELIKSGAKDVEYRLNDEKRQKIQIGDMITFYKRPLEDEMIQVVVTDKKYYDTLLEMYSATFDRELKNRYSSVQAVVDDTTYYTEEEIEKYGCVAIHFRKVK